MIFHEFGEENEDLIIMFHPLGVQWDVYDYVLPTLSQHFHVLIPAISGFDPDEPQSDFVSVEQIAEETTQLLKNRNLNKVRCLYGCSMGGSVVMKILSEQKIQADFYIMDGGITPYELWKPFTYLIGIRDFLWVFMGKHLSINLLRKMFNPDKYTDEDLKYIKKCMGSMSNRTIWNAFYSTNNYSIHLPIMRPTGHVIYWYGDEEEKDRAWDIKYIKKHLPYAEIRENKGMGHAEFFTLFPDKFVNQIQEILQR